MLDDVPVPTEEELVALAAEREEDESMARYWTGIMRGIIHETY